MQATYCYNSLAFPGYHTYRNYSFNFRCSSSKPDWCPSPSCSNSQWWYSSCSQLLQSCRWEWALHCYPLYCHCLYGMCHYWESGSYHTNCNYVFPSMLYGCELVLLPSGSSRCSQLASSVEIPPLELLSPWSITLYRYVSLHIVQSWI